jgi:signal transduction histidine kinase
VNKKNVKVEFSRDSKKIYLFLDEMGIKQALINLINNSIDSVEQGGLIQIETKRQNSKVKLIIKDNGHGIPEDKLKKVFIPYFSTKKDGMGLGLLIVDKIVKDHHGTIEVKSEVNEGTEVTITL